MKLELELKYVQNYLDSSIKCIYKGDKYNVVKCSRNWIWIINQENELLKLKYSKVKLILIPLSNIEDYFLDIWGNPKSEFYKETCTYTDTDYLESYGNLEIETIKITIVEYLPVGLYNLLLKHHFDVFGLIPKGLAIDINTL